ncbi:MAG: site-specific integrase [Lachnospiraceae bacterium]|nr:site-specific integrase [Lachnospiraceae bacterium]
MMERMVVRVQNNSFAYYLTKYFSEYLPNQVAASGNTIRSYRDAFVQLMDFYKQEYRIPPERLTYSDFTAERIEAFLHSLEEKRGIGISTRNQRLAAIHSFFRYIQYRDPAGFEQCAVVLSVPFKKTEAKPMNYMTLEEIRLLLSLPETGNDSQLRDLAVMTMLYESGARVQEVIDLTPANVRFSSTAVVELHGKGNKTRLVPINADAASIVRNYIRRCKRTDISEPLFVNRKGEKLTRAGIQYIIDKYVSTARERRPDLFKNKISNHCFRHSKAMHLLEAGINLVYIRDFLGHTSVVTTEIYAKTNPKIKEDQLKKHSASVTAPEKYSRKEKEDLIDWLKNNL